MFGDEPCDVLNFLSSLTLCHFKWIHVLLEGPHHDIIIISC